MTVRGGLRVFVVVVMIIAGQSLLQPRAEAATNVEVLQLNMMGLISQTSAGRIDGQNYVMDRMFATSPLVVSLNEVCLSQVAYLANHVPGYTAVYLPSFARTGSSSDTDCRNSAGKAEYGNAILIRLTYQGRVDWFYSATDSGSTRNMVCAKSSYIFIVYVGCSTHLSSPPPASQMAENVYVVSAQSGTSFSLGDFNTSRSTLLANAPAYSTNFREADITSPKRATGDAGGAIDFVFGKKAAMTVASNALISADLSFSDHRSVRGFYSVA